MRGSWRSWGTTVVLGGGVGAGALLGALLLGDGRALTGVLAALALVGGAALFSLPVLAVMGVAPQLAFLVGMTTYGFQVVLGGVLLYAGRPGGPLVDLLDVVWLGGSLVALAVAVTAGVVVDQVRAGRAGTAQAEAAPRTSTPGPT